MAFRKGGEAAQKAAENSGGKFFRAQYLSIEDDGQVVVRYITDEPDWPFVLQHAGAPTKNPPADWDTTKQRWPESMPAVCRYDPGFEGKYSDCYLCDAAPLTKYGRPSKASPRSWAIACLREEVVGTPELVAQGVCDESKIGKRLGYTDQYRDVTRTDDKGVETATRERALVIVNFAPGNYFNGLTAAAGIYDGTVCRHDFVVKKSGRGKDVEYTHIAVNETPDFVPGTAKWEERYLKAVAEQGLDLEALINDRASDEYFARFFDPNKTPAPRQGEGGQSASSAQPTPSVPATPADDVDAERLAAMRERVRGNAPAAVGAGVGAPEID